MSGVNKTDSNSNSGDVNNDEDYYDPDLDLPPSNDNSHPVDDKNNVNKNNSNYNKNNPYPGQPYGSGSKNLGMPGQGGVSPGGDLPDPGSNPELQSYVQQLKSQGFSDSQIHDMVLNNYGIDLSQGDISYLASGTMPGMPNKYQQYSTMSKNLGGSYTSWGSDQQQMMKFLEQQQQSNDAKDQASKMKKSDAESKVKIHMILLQIMMGDIVGALRSYAVLMDRDLRNFTRLIVDKLDKVREARSQVIRNFANTKPPTAYAGSNPASAARSQDRSAKYTQYVQMSTQLMGELQNTERELVDALQTEHRDLQTFWESYAGFRDQEFRTNDRVMTIR